ncbi:hypothetical protein [Szabonella alba]|uniref:Uncharacterized protein n=1 Tax=Szabonella alba TaxID=2804194 RepID=A0A8K0Y2B8_9RHOB|nr:hypothetical protein [Szabonella alba]MBL4917254.1 hypothetical protein [Szabonella alba]
MKFNPLNWSEVKPNEKIETGKGILRLRASQTAALYIEAQGVEALYGLGADFDVEVSEAVAFRVDAPKGTRVFHYRPGNTSFEPTGEVYTNIDRMPDESGTLAEVLRARRVFELEQRAMLREMRAETAKQLKLLKAQNKASLVEPSPAPAPADPPAPDPEE